MTDSGHVLIVAVVVVAVGSVLGGGPVTALTAGVDAVTYSGDGTAAVDGQQPLLWQSADHRFTVTVSTTDAYDGDACLETTLNRSDRTERLACERVRLPANATRNVTVSVDEWPSELTGAQSVRGYVGNASGGTRTASASTPVAVVRKSGDLDGDGLSNQREASLGSELRGTDSDGDGIGDALEVDTYGTDPTDADTDGDDLSDGAEVHEHQTDPTAADTDGDGLADPREVALGTNPNRADSDGDGVDDGREVNVYETDPLAADSDDDGLDDGTETADHETNPLRSDTDGDDLADGLEVNTYGTDPTEVDSDDDGLPDGVEVHEHQTDPTVADTDGDGLTDGQEVNTYGTNPTNEDTDGDRLRDGAEVNDYRTNPDEVDSDGDGESDYVEVDPNSGLPLVAVTAGLLALVLVVGTVGLARSRSIRGIDVRIDGSIPTVPVDVAGRLGESAEPDENDESEPDGSARDVPLELLSNEEQIRRILDDHDGRIRQADLVDETDWSKSKVSRVLSEMEADGEIEKIDVGGGNVVTRADEVPTGAGRPFED
ncbi:DUF7343 domain-containing protein [Halosimplex amylolyticum]|uniref:helix-turn-helix transcriptional regulator n=1 Tax=Halosimplex amylolyticum TaxID=3396616 RepID=UPI003F54A4A7